MVATLIERTPIADLRRIDDRSPQIGREEEFGATKVRRSNTDDGVGMLIDLHGAAHCGGIAVKVAVPERIAQNDLGHTVRPMFFGSMDESAKIGLNAEGVEIIAAYRIGPDYRGISVAGIEPNAAHDVVEHQRVETAVSVTQVAVIRIRL